MLQTGTQIQLQGATKVPRPPILFAVFSVILEFQSEILPTDLVILGIWGIVFPHPVHLWQTNFCSIRLEKPTHPDICLISARFFTQRVYCTGHTQTHRHTHTEPVVSAAVTAAYQCCDNYQRGTTPLLIGCSHCTTDCSQSNRFSNYFFSH